MFRAQETSKKIKEEKEEEKKKRGENGPEGGEEHPLWSFNLTSLSYLL